MSDEQQQQNNKSTVFRWLLIFLVPLIFLAIWNYKPDTTVTKKKDKMSIAPLVFPAASRHTATVIFVHGLGDTGHGWASAVENWRRRQRLDEVKFILPHAPQIPISVNMGMRMPGWFDVKQLGGDVNTLIRSEDTEGIKRSQQYFHNLIQEEIDAGIPSERIVLGGFSQGGAMSILSGLTCKNKLGGIIGMSSWLLLSQSFAGMVSPTDANRQTPVKMFHGDADPIVNIQRGKLSVDLLKELGYDVTWKVYPGMGHSACLEELDEVEAFLRQQLPPKN
ncbi:Acyl-protein thioesterase 1 [Fusarium keratoplasticum]|uniref:Acyl-protein thioesterase 1 n=1 Tax=Fusarium keratoplasticum TaxID=1328300 RepID=A0ACC0QXQ2_9HYPO|nr:Acyl-protein thioesterase 1 [Fusarium keratoplasticum]KAI8669539.1 Acyl-protein thioesterase 1 [Fusarium keratoplasticum]